MRWFDLEEDGHWIIPAHLEWVNGEYTKFLYLYDDK